MSKAWNLPAGRRVVFWRHGQTVWNVERRFQGTTDIALDEVGLSQAAGAAPALASMQPAAIVSSDLARAMDTAGALARLTGLPVTPEEGLRETFGGQWQGLTRPEILARDEALLMRWIAGHDVAPAGGEYRGDVVKRVVAAVESHLNDVPDGGTLVIVSHGGAIRAGIGGLLGLAPEQWTALGVIANAAWSVLGQMTMPPAAGDGPPITRWRLLEYNATSVPGGGDRGRRRLTSQFRPASRSWC
ncbi:MAG: histidine phosphatase family protein [Candidatus Nanopelagicales bacterium]